MSQVPTYLQAYKCCVPPHEGWAEIDLFLWTSYFQGTICHAPNIIKQVGNTYKLNYESNWRTCSITYCVLVRTSSALLSTDRCALLTASKLWPQVKTSAPAGSFLSPEIRYTELFVTWSSYSFASFKRGGKSKTRSFKKKKIFRASWIWLMPCYLCFIFLLFTVE